MPEPLQVGDKLIHYRVYEVTDNSPKPGYHFLRVRTDGVTSAVTEKWLLDNCVPLDDQLASALGIAP